MTIGENGLKLFYSKGATPTIETAVSFTRAPCSYVFRFLAIDDTINN
nr:MAG TPA: hypothetical protein [Bacteriophage sp.]